MLDHTETQPIALIAAKWKALQAPFDAESVSLLPRATGDKDKRYKQKCQECGGYHEFPCIHLSYVGHADITMRLNDVDPEWTWEPMSYDANGLPALDANGCLWAWLTIMGVRKPAYGDPGLDWKGDSKKGTPDGMKEAIGDMLRNGAMRFGVGTALWSKSDKAKATLIPEDDEPSGKTHGSGERMMGGDATAKLTPRKAGDLVKEAEKYGYKRRDVTTTAINKYGLIPGEDGKVDLCGLTVAQAEEIVAAMAAHPKGAKPVPVEEALGATVISEEPNDDPSGPEIPF